MGQPSLCFDVLPKCLYLCFFGDSDELNGWGFGQNQRDFIVRFPGSRDLIYQIPNKKCLVWGVGPIFNRLLNVVTY
jgi:hypothetical protein